MTYTILNKRRRQLGMTIIALARMSGVPIATVNRILVKPGKVRFENVAAVGQVLGVDFSTARRVPIKQILRNRAMMKAQYVARIVQGTQGLEAAGVDKSGYERLVEVATETLLAGKKRKLWDEE